MMTAAPVVEPLSCPEAGVSGHFVTVGQHTAFVDQHGVVTATELNVEGLPDAHDLAALMEAVITLAESLVPHPAPMPR